MREKGKARRSRRVEAGTRVGENGRMGEIADGGTDGVAENEKERCA
jgi:hypothetical protein